MLIDITSFELDEESPDEEYYGPEEKKELKRFTLEHPYTQEKIIQLIELFRKYRVGNFIRCNYFTLAEIMREVLLICHWIDFFLLYNLIFL